MIQGGFNNILQETLKLWLGQPRGRVKDEAQVDVRIRPAAAGKPALAVQDDARHAGMNRQVRRHQQGIGRRKKGGQLGLEVNNSEQSYLLKRLTVKTAFSRSNP